MTAARQTFVVQVHADGGAVLLDEQRREYVWLRHLSELPDQIAGRVDLGRQEATAKGGQPCSDKDG